MDTVWIIYIDKQWKLWPLIHWNDNRQEASWSLLNSLVVFEYQPFFGVSATSSLTFAAMAKFARAAVVPGNVLPRLALFLLGTAPGVESGLSVSGLTGRTEGGVDWYNSFSSTLWAVTPRRSHSPFCGLCALAGGWALASGLALALVLPSRWDSSIDMPQHSMVLMFMSLTCVICISASHDLWEGFRRSF